MDSSLVMSPRQNEHWLLDPGTIDISARISMMSMTVVRWESIDSDLPNKSQAWQGITR